MFLGLKLSLTARLRGSTAVVPEGVWTADDTTLTADSTLITADGSQP